MATFGSGTSHTDHVRECGRDPRANLRILPGFLVSEEHGPEKQHP